MSRTAAVTTVRSGAFASWRATSLGSITEALEQQLILGLMGELRGRQVLDVGCGDGALLCAAAVSGAEVTGIDPDPAMLAAARARAATQGVRATMLEGTVEHLPFPDASFDVVACTTVLCFVPEPAAAVREMARVLRPGGCLVLGDLGRWSPWAALRRLRGWLGSSTWRSARFRTATELRELAEQAGLSVTMVRGAIFYPPIGFMARILAPLDSRLGQLMTIGAAFIVVTGASRRRQ